MKRDWFFWCTCLLAAVALVVVAYVYIQKSPLVEERLDTLTSFQEQQLQLFQGRAGMLLTLATLIVGGAGALVLHFYETGSGSAAQQRWAVLTLLTAGLSIFFGYLAYDAAIWMLRSKFFNLETEALSLPSQLQLATSGVALLFLILCFLSASKPKGR